MHVLQNPIYTSIASRTSHNNISRERSLFYPLEVNSRKRSSTALTMETRTPKKIVQVSRCSLPTTTHVRTGLSKLFPSYSSIMFNTYFLSEQFSSFYFAQVNLCQFAVQQSNHAAISRANNFVSNNCMKCLPPQANIDSSLVTFPILSCSMAHG